jgi:membrane associated rhomboid family serine protease
VHLYIVCLSVMCVLFCLSAGVLFFVALGQAVRRRLERAAVYLGLTLLSGIVAAGFYFFRRLL